jgi:hypothetical protein
MADLKHTNGTNLNDGSVAIIFPDNKKKVVDGIESKDSKKILGFIFYFDTKITTLNYYVITKISKDAKDNNKIQFHVKLSYDPEIIFIFDEIDPSPKASFGIKINIISGSYDNLT